MHHHMEHAGGLGLLNAAMGALTAVLFVAALVGLLHLLHRRGMLPTQNLKALGARAQLGGAHAAPSGRSPAEDHLDMALARGEIDVAEYHERRSALRSHG